MSMIRKYHNHKPQTTPWHHEEKPLNQEVCKCSMFCCTLLYVHSSIAIILMGKRELVPLLNLSSWCLMMVERLFLAVPQGCLWFVIVVFPDHTHLLFLTSLQFILHVNCVKRVLKADNILAKCQTLKHFQ